jgi:hypothetical protein
VLALLQELVYNSRLESGVRNASFNSASVKEKHGFNNIDFSTRERDAILGFEGMKEEMVLYYR